jgi:D-alanine-D-alanine ligase
VTQKLRVAVVFGGRSGEHEVSLMSARSVLAALDPGGYDVLPVGISKEGLWYCGEGVLEALQRGQVEGLDRAAILGEPGRRGLYRWISPDRLEMSDPLDAVFPVTHGSYGEDGTLQGLFEMADIPYVGSGVLASAVAMDKGLFKEVMRANHVPVVESAIVLSTTILDSPEEAVGQAERVGPYPLFTKPANLGSSVGVTKCRSRGDLVEGLIDAARYDRRVIVEVGLEAREIEISVLGNEDPEASVAGEVVPSDEFYSYRAKYIDDASELHIPAAIDEETAEEARRLAVAAFKALDGAGMARADFLLDRNTGRLVVNELNTLPGFTQISMYPKLWEASGLPYPALMDRLIELALARQAQKDRLLRTYGGAG